MESRLSIAGQAVQPILVMFPLGLFAMAVIFDVANLLGGPGMLGALAYWNIVAGLAGGFLAMLAGAGCGIPGASYLTGLHILITSKASTANQVIGVILFVLIEFLLIIIPFTFLELRPEATKAALKNAQDWLLGHARQLMAYTAMILGAYLTISAVVRLA